MTHTLINQLRFARSEFVRCLEGISDEDARQRIMPMNCISWMVGHMAAQEQFYFVYFPQGEILYPELVQQVGFGYPATTPPLAEMWQAWHDITKAADTFLDTVTPEQLLIHMNQGTDGLEKVAFGNVTKKILAQSSVRSSENLGTKLQRATFHYFFHTGEAHAVRQLLGHPDLPYFVGDMPDFAGYMEEAVYQSYAA